MNNSPKITTSELVLSAIFFLQQKNGVTSRDITKFICEKRGCKQNQIRGEVKKALEKATLKGIFQKKRGLYRIKSSFGRNIISQNVRNLEDKRRETNIDGTRESHRTSFDRKIFRVDHLGKRNNFVKKSEVTENEAFQNSFYLRADEDDFANQSGENISIERLRVCRSDDDDDDFLEEDEYDDDDVDFFADDQSPTSEEAATTPRELSKNVTKNEPQSEKKDRNDLSENTRPKKKSQKRSNSTKNRTPVRCEKPRRPAKKVSLQDDDDDEFDLDFEGEENGKEDNDSRGKHFKQEQKENKRNEKQKRKAQELEENQSVNTESSENLLPEIQEDIQEDTWNEDEDYFEKTDLNAQKLRLSCDEKLQKFYQGEENKNEDFQREEYSDVGKDKVEPEKTPECGNVETSMRSTERQDVLSEPESTEKKSRRERSSSLFRAPRTSTASKRKSASHSKPIKHRKFN